METRETKNCPYCGEEILAVAKKCKHCGEWMPEPPQPKKMVPCPICGEDVEEGTEICPHCKEKIVFEPSLESVQESRPNNLVSSPSAPVSPVVTTAAPDSLFKDFMKSKSLSSGLMLLLGAYMLTCLLGLFENPAIDLFGAALLIVIGCAMSLLVIQRVAQDRSKIDLCSWTAIGSAIATPIAIYLGRSGVNDMGLDVFEFAKAGDTSEGVIYLRYMIYSGIVFYVIAYLLELVSKGFMWSTAKNKFKSTIIVGIVACVSGLLYVMCSKSLSQGILIGWMCLTSFLYLIYFIVLLINGSGEGASTGQGTSAESSSSTTNEQSSDIQIFLYAITTMIILLVILLLISLLFR